MRKLSQRFVVAITPEHYTSKTCCKCLGECGPWKEVEEKDGRVCPKTGKRLGIRGLRICQNEECKLPQNRDRTGASNIGLNFCRLMRGQPPIRSMTDEERELCRLELATCPECSSD